MLHDQKYAYAGNTAFRVGTKLEPGTPVEQWEKDVFPWHLRTTPALFCPSNGDHYPGASVLKSQDASDVRVFSEAILTNIRFFIDNRRTLS